MLLSLAQLHLQMGGPVEDLEDAISELYADLDQKIYDENDNWAVTSNSHEKRVDELQSNIDYADGDVKTSIQKLENVLVPLEQQIEAEIETVTDRIQVNNDAIEREKSQRESDARDYNEKVKEHQDGIDACDEAIKLVNELMNSSPSLIQIRKAKNSVANIQKKLGKKNQYSPLIKALTQLAIDQNFSDQDTVQKIVDLLENLRENLTSSLQSINNDEKSAQQNYQDWLDQLNQELDELETTLDQRKLDAQTTKTDIDNETAFQNQRAEDLAGFQSDLETETTNYEALSEAHDNLISALEEEQNNVKAAVDILTKVNVREYLYDRANAE